MRKTNQLFQLIQTFSKSEKRYFKLAASAQGQGKNKTYMRLFDVLSKKECDDATLCEMLKRTNKQLADDKNYLHELLLNKLTHFNKSINEKVQNMLNQVEVLYEKSLLSLIESKLIFINNIFILF